MQIDGIFMLWWWFFGFLSSTFKSQKPDATGAVLSLYEHGNFRIFRAAVLSYLREILCQRAQWTRYNIPDLATTHQTLSTSFVCVKLCRGICISVVCLEIAHNCALCWLTRFIVPHRTLQNRVFKNAVVFLVKLGGLCFQRQKLSVHADWLGADSHNVSAIHFQSEVTRRN
jgi:hypothetical protein